MDNQKSQDQLPQEAAIEPAAVPETPEIPETPDIPEIPETPETEVPAEQELDLESIINEFRELDEEDLPEPELPAEMLPHPAEEEAPALEEPEIQEPEQPAVTSDTIRMDLSSLPKGVYQGAAPVEEEPEPTAPAEQAEPFSENWEPEYEQPMGEYVPPQPILFHPQSRLQELKKKLVNGPERRYYQLTEKGTGKLQILLFLSLVITLLCVGSTVLHHFGMVQENRLKLMIFGQLLAMFLCALIGSYQLIEGLADLVRGRFSLNTLLIFSFILCCADGFLCLQELRVPCCAAFTLQIFLSLLDTLHRRRTEIRQMDTLRKASNLTALRPSQEKLDGRKVLIRDDGQVEDFMPNYNARSLPEKVRTWYAIGALIASVAVGVTGLILHGVSAGLQIAAVTLLAAVPASFFICLSRPAAILGKRFEALGTLLCGWKGISFTKGKTVFPLTHQDIFPAGTTKMNGVKFFGNRDPDEVVAYGTALILADQNGLAPLFEQVLESRNCQHLSVQELAFYDGGIGGEVRGEPVLVGNLNFLREMGVEIPEGLRVSQAVCVAIDGVLSGLFAITYEKSRACAGGLHTLCGYRNVNPVVTDGDFLLNPNFLHGKFGINPKRIFFANHELRQTIAAQEPDRDVPPAVLSTKQDLPSLAYGVTGARALRSASYLGLIVHMVGGIIGIGIMLTLTLIGALNLLTPLNVILFQLIWSIPGLLLTEWTRLI